MASDHSTWCGMGVHDADDTGMCIHCHQMAGAVDLSAEPLDFSLVKRELESVHRHIRSSGFDQTADDGSWGMVEGYFEPEWSEIGNTVQALRKLEIWAEQRGFYDGLYKAPPDMKLVPVEPGDEPERDATSTTMIDVGSPRGIAWALLAAAIMCGIIVTLVAVL